jgi:translation initiation factor 1 (eIF-1/SUI1)
LLLTFRLVQLSSNKVFNYFNGFPRQKSMKAIKNQNTGVVYSTELGKVCPACGKAAAGCVCRTSKQEIPNDGIVRVRRETKGRKGSGVTVVTGIPLDEQSLKKFGFATETKMRDRRDGQSRSSGDSRRSASFTGGRTIQIGIQSQTFRWVMINHH